MDRITITLKLPLIQGQNSASVTEFLYSTPLVIVRILDFIYGSDIPDITIYI